MALEYAPAPLPAHDLAPPETMVYLLNPASSNHQRGVGQISGFEQRGVEVVVIETTREGREANQQRVRDLLHSRFNPDAPQSLWLTSATGDGTIRDMGAMLLTQDPEIAGIPLLPLPGGNGNDIASMAHSLLGKYMPARRLHRAQLQPIQPLQCEAVDQEGEPLQHFGIGYISLGISGEAARQIDKDRGHNRLVQLTREKIHALRALGSVSAFGIEEDGQQRSLVERVWANGQRMAKHVKWPNKLESAHFLDAEIPEGSLLRYVTAAGKLAIGRLPAHSVTKPEAVQFELLNPAVMQIDGESFGLGEGPVRVQQADGTLNLVRVR